MSTILDLYCGMGNLSLPLARQGGQVLGIEQSALAVQAARENARRLGLPARFFHASAKQGVKQLLEQARRFDAVILDPPRKGAKELMPLLRRLQPGRIVYVSCDPPTLARDLSLLAPLYLPCSVQPIDMFPQTHHVETVAVLERSSDTAT
jgi:23S rRNA (uracil1939-C5)-methyltransferase